MKQVRHRYALSILCVYFLGCGLATQTRAQDQPGAAFEGRPIASIAFEPSRQPLETNDLNEILPVKPGQPYDADTIRAAIERLYATGRYQDIQVDARPSDGGVAIRFITRNSWFTGKVAADVDFAEPPNAGQIVNASRLQLGEPFDMDQVFAAVDNIRRLLVQNGYFDPVIDPQLGYDSIYERVNITFKVKTGKRASYLTPQVSGDTSVLSAEAIAKATHWHRFLLPGYRGITSSRTRSGIDKVRLKYQNSNRLLATVVLNEIEEQKPQNKGLPKITVNPGPNVTITTPGTKISKRHLRQNIPVFEEHSVDPDLLTEGANNLRDYFQAQGYFDVGVQYKEQQVVNGAEEITYIIERGRRHKFVHLDISGNKYFDEKTIRERMFLMPSSFAIRNGRYSEAFVRRDIDTIKDVYESNGFRDVKITTRSVDNYKGHAGDLAEFFNIEEGPQSLVASLDVQGANKLDLKKTIASLSSQPGQIFSEYNVAADRETIIRQYEQNGFPNATFEWSSRPGPRPNTFALQFVVDEGQQQFVRDVVITGLDTTRQSLVDKQLELKPGSPLSPTAMADIQRRLYDLGIFSQVDMAIQNPDGVEDRKYVLYNLDEARRYSLTLGFGLQFARIGGSNAVTDLSDPGGAPGVVPSGSVAVSRLNLFGLGQTATVQGVVSTLQRRGVFSYQIPKVFDLQNFDANFSLLYDDTFDVRTFQSTREEGSIKITQHVTKPITIFYDFTYRHVGVSNLKIDPLLLPQLAQSVRVGIAEINFIQDRRDDPVDAHKGIYNTIDVGLATKAFGSQTSFARILARNATYHRLGSKLVFARETQVGLQPAFSIPSTAEPDDPIPLAERFFAGGGNTQRGFPENQAGPRDLLTGFPLGGSAMFFNNTELRFPLYGSNINGVLFEDAGNVFPNISSITFRVDQRNPQDFDYMVHAVGFGIRYRTPIGPIRLDLADSLNPPKFNGFPGNYSQLVQCSAANTCQASLQQISHFQFFFSIGQAF
ncbi:MAG TPA: POTRA domain-containing protein [Bryobacteraceae bacterium]|nr:POTRA domain-containing protein [Bryobacteraceae bacterium]